MTSERRNEIDAFVEELTLEFKESIDNGNPHLGVLYMSCDTNEMDVSASLECNKLQFRAMIRTLMAWDKALADDLISCVADYVKEL